MSEEHEEIRQIEEQIKDMEAEIAKAEKLERLKKNKDFQELIEEDYFIQESSRMLLLKDDPALNDEQREYLKADMHGPGAFKRYLHHIEQLARIARQSIPDAKETLDELRAEYAGAPGSASNEEDHD